MANSTAPQPTPLLFTPLQLRSLTLPNRIAVSPMCQYSVVDGVPSAWHMVHLGSRAVGGAGLVMVEATAVLPEGRISPQDVGLWNQEQAEAFAPIVDFVHQQGAHMGVQLAHAGRKASMRRPWGQKEGIAGEDEGGWAEDVVGPSPLAFSATYPTPNELSRDGIEQVIAAFRQSAERALAAGFDLVEIHGAHGYLLHQFLSPLANHRTDEYGGSLANRARLLLEVTLAVRSVWPAHLPIFVRLSATDWVEGGLTVDETVEIAVWLREAGVDLVDVSSGGGDPRQQIPVGPGYQVPFAARVQREAGVPSGAVGMITEATQAEAILQNGEASLVLLAREMLRDPYWPLHAAEELGIDAPWPAQYLRAAHRTTPPRQPVTRPEAG